MESLDDVPEERNRLLGVNIWLTLAELLYRCDYAATMEGLIFNKMIVDTIFFAGFIPYWAQCILFFIVSWPISIIIFFDDILVGSVIYWKANLITSYFDWGILAGKLIRLIF